MEQDKITQEQQQNLLNKYEERNNSLVERGAISKKIDPKEVEKMKKAKEKAVKTNQIVTKINKCIQ